MEPVDHRGDRLFDCQAVEEAGVDHDAGVVLEREGLFFDIAAGDDLDDLATELFGEDPVAVVMGRHGHDGAGAVGDKHIVGDEDRDLFAVDRVDAAHTVDLHAGLVLVELAALKIGLAGCLVHVGFNFGPVCDLVLPLLDIGVLRGQDHVGRAEERIGAGREDRQLVPGRGLEADLRTGGATDPVALLGLDALDIVHIVQIVDQALGILRDAEHPLALLLADDVAAAALALALDHFFVGQDALAACAPVDGHRGLVGKPVFKELQEDPLRPLVVLRIGGIDHAVPVEAVAEHLELTGKILDIPLGDDGGVDVVFDGKVFGGQTEGVKTDRIEDVIALHALFTRDNVHGRKGARMAHVQSGGAGVRELDQAIEFGLVTAGLGRIGLALFPPGLPFLFDGGKIVFHTDTLSYYCSIMIIGWRKAKMLFAAPLCGAAKQPRCFAIYSLQ